METVRDGCVTCGRTVVENGATLLVEAARVIDGREPALEFMATLGEGKKKDLERLASLMFRIEHYARYGELVIPRELNELRDGLWEVKAGDVRMIFFAADHSDRGAIRLTNGFVKSSQRTPRREIDTAIWVRREDAA